MQSEKVREKLFLLLYQNDPTLTITQIFTEKLALDRTLTKPKSQLLRTQNKIARIIILIFFIFNSKIFRRNNRSFL